MKDSRAVSGLGTRLRSLVAALDGGVQATYARHGFAFRPRYYPIVRYLLTEGEAGVGALAAAIGVTQPAATQTLTEMRREGLVTTTPGTDRRCRRVRLTDEASLLADALAPIWRATESAAQKLDAEVGGNFGTLLNTMLECLAAEPFDQRIEGEIHA